MDQRASSTHAEHERWRPTVKTGIHILFAVPMAVLAIQCITDSLGWTSDLGVNPIETVIRALGDWALRFLIIALAVTPVRRVFNIPTLTQYRRMTGLWAFAYVAVHLLFFIGVDQFFDWKEIGKQIVKNKFILAGMIGFLSLLPLAITSNSLMIRRMGFARWKKLHQLIYVAGFAAAIHYIWMVKADIRQPLVYAVIIAVLLGLRAYWGMKEKAKAAAMRPPVRGSV